MADKLLGPKAKELLAHFIAREAVPDGGGIADGLDFLANAERRRAGMERAKANLDNALLAIKAAPDNPYGDDDEVIAAAILERIAVARVASR